MTELPSAKETVAALKLKYPNPMAGPDSRRTKDCYCVAGAAMMEGILPNFMTPGKIAMGWFPGEDDIHRALEVMTGPSNLSSCYESCFVSGIRVAQRNDNKDFDGAWRALGQALVNTGKYRE